MGTPMMINLVSGPGGGFPWNALRTDGKVQSKTGDGYYGIIRDRAAEIGQGEHEAQRTQ
jgi:hypothetical protein